MKKVWIFLFVFGLACAAYAGGGNTWPSDTGASTWPAETNTGTWPSDTGAGTWPSDGYPQANDGYPQDGYPQEISSSETDAQEESVKETPSEETKDILPQNDSNNEPYLEASEQKHFNLPIRELLNSINTEDALLICLILLIAAEKVRDNNSILTMLSLLLLKR